MNRQAILLGVLYSVIVIAFKLFILLGNYTFTKFGFFYSQLITLVLIIPFIWLTIKTVKTKNGGIISGKEAVRVALTMCIIAAALIGIYHVIEFEWKMKALSVQYYNSEQFLTYLKSIPKLKQEDYPKYITEAINGLSSFKALTAKLFSFLFFGISASFIFAVFMKRNSL